jgi:hypothetical protein
MTSEPSVKKHIEAGIEKFRNWRKIYFAGWVGGGRRAKGAIARTFHESEAFIGKAFKGLAIF